MIFYKFYLVKFIKFDENYGKTRICHAFVCMWKTSPQSSQMHSTMFHRMHFIMLHICHRNFTTCILSHDIYPLPVTISLDVFHHVTPTPEKISLHAFCHVTPTSVPTCQNFTACILRTHFR